MRNYLGIAMLTVLVACTAAPKKDLEAADTAASLAKSAPMTDVSLADPKLGRIYKGYISLKNSLVASNPAAAHQTALDLSLSLKAFSGCENTALIADKIAGTEDIKVQRREFTALSSDVIALFKHADLKKGVIYIQHCPMANDGNGGDWLSAEKKIRNPFYGDQMMDCGGVVEEIRPR